MAPPAEIRGFAAAGAGPAGFDARLAGIIGSSLAGRATIAAQPEAPASVGPSPLLCTSAPMAPPPPPREGEPSVMPASAETGAVTGSAGAESPARRPPGAESFGGAPPPRAATSSPSWATTQRPTIEASCSRARRAESPCFIFRLFCSHSVHSTLSRSVKCIMNGRIQSRTANCATVARRAWTSACLPTCGCCSRTVLICLPSVKNLLSFEHSGVSTPCSCSDSGQHAGKRPIRWV